MGDGSMTAVQANVIHRTFHRIAEIGHHKMQEGFTDKLMYDAGLDMFRILGRLESKVFCAADVAGDNPLYERAVDYVGQEVA